MSYEIVWYIPEEVLRLNMRGQSDKQELEEIDQAVLQILKENQRGVRLLIDFSELEVGYDTVNTLRSTQTYMNRQSVKSALFVTDNKLTRLITLLAFSMSRVLFIQFETLAQAESYLQSQYSLSN